MYAYLGHVPPSLSPHKWELYRSLRALGAAMRGRKYPSYWSHSCCTSRCRNRVWCSRSAQNKGSSRDCPATPGPWPYPPAPMPQGTVRAFWSSRRRAPDTRQQRRLWQGECASVDVKPVLDNGDAQDELSGAQVRREL